MRSRLTLALFTSAVLGILVLPSVVQARSRTGSDLGSRVAALEAQNAAQSAQIAALQVNDAAQDAAISANATALVTHMGSGDHDHRYVRDSGENLRIIRGSVFASGTIASGSGFTITKVATGGYVISYATPFSSTMIVASVIRAFSADSCILLLVENASSAKTRTASCNWALKLPTRWRLFVTGL